MYPGPAQLSVVPAAVTGDTLTHTQKVQESKRERKWCARRAACRNHVFPHLCAPPAPLPCVCVCVCYILPTITLNKLLYIALHE